MNFETIRRNYERKLWTKQMVRMAVRKGLITRAQYAEITGEAYAA
ncbi:MAG: XkdX family protein [Butyricicoccaceae bacterium]